jgi:hypothetical protein
MKPHHRVVQEYQARLAAAVSRSPLLKATISKNSRLLDCSRLHVVSENLPRVVLDAVVGGGKPAPIDLSPKTTRPKPALVLAAPNQADSGNLAPAPWGDPTNRDLQGLYHLLDHRIRRHGEQAKRLTGVHAVWLGYPLLYLSVGEGVNREWLLAPVFLWPVSLVLNLRHSGHIMIGRDRVAGPPQFNEVMASRVGRWRAVNLAAPSEDALNELDWDTIGRHLSRISEHLDLWPEIDCSGPLEAIPSANSLKDQPDQRLFHAAILGIFQAKDGAILKDLDELKGQDLGEGVAAAFAEGALLPASPPESPPSEEDRYFVSEADFSQEKVVWKARQQPGLVVHGPPGTGKSQTIVNIIADALAHGRTVLMVCQKQAATRVVMERLRAAGLADLCIEASQPEADRQAIFGAIRAQVSSLAQVGQAQLVESQRRAQFARQISALESQLDSYARALHEEHPRFGLSYRQMKAIEGQAEASFPTVRALPSLHHALGECSFADLEELCRRANETGCLFHRADALNNPWRLRQPNLRMSATLRTDVEAALERLQELDSRHLEHIGRFGPGIEQPTDPADFLTTAPEVVRRLQPLVEEQATPAAQLIRKWLKVIRDSGDVEHGRLVSRCGEAVALAERVKATSLDPLWAERLEGLSEAQVEDVLDATRIVLAWRGRWWGFLSPTYHRSKAALHRLRPGAIGEAFWSSAESLRDHLEARSLRAQLRRMNESLNPQAPFRQLDEHSQLRFPHLASETLEIAIWLRSAGRSRPWIGELLEASVASSGRPRLAELLDKTRVSLERAPMILNLREALAGLGSFLLPEGLEEPGRLIEGRRSIREWTKDVTQGLDGLQALMALDLDCQHRDGLACAVLGALEDYERDLRAGHAQQLPEPPNRLPASEYGGWWQALVRFAASRLWQGACESEHPELIGITPDEYSEKVRQLRDLLERKRAMEAEAVRGHWATRQAAHRNAPWTQMFALRGGRRNGGAKTLRQAIELSLPHGLLDMRPCWLANPASVSQIFPLRESLFDLVVFDEASQCPIEQALPAIYRGKALIVSGDEKQLPPTNFFLTQWQNPDGDGSDEDESDVEAIDNPVEASARQLQQLGQQFMLDVQDLLQAAVGLFPRDAQAKLLVHYRSRDPALIEFSNHAFYEGQLEAPPSAHANSCGAPPIRYRSVNGTYRDRINCDEAREIVRVLKEFWLRNGPSPTIGVVTFNKPQQELIEDLIEKECHHDEAFAVRYQQELSHRDGNQDVGFFVRNLENVQGDERDVMIFSTTFGRDPGNNFLRNFGPVGQVGGERRLNVAVTRARDQVIIMGSMPIDKIATALSPHLGPGAQLAPRDYLQLYLAYAEAVSAGDRARAEVVLRRLRSSDLPTPPPRPESPFEQEVLDVLERWGLTVKCQVGESGFRIDLGVRHRDPARGYALGIECDGATYHSDRSARARDIWREDILRRQGWLIHRIWSTRWWSYREQEITRLQDEVERALSR